MVQNFNKALVIDKHFIVIKYFKAFHCTLLQRISENSNVFVQLFLGVIARMKPGVDGEVFIANEAGENEGTF